MYQRVAGLVGKTLGSFCFLLLLHCCCLRTTHAKENLLVVRYQKGFLFKNIIFRYDDEDIVSSVSLGRRCEAFIRNETEKFGVDGFQEAETKPHAINICRQVAEMLGIPYDAEAYYTQKHVEEWDLARSTIAFLDQGWIVGVEVLPELREREVIESIMQTLMKCKFEHILDALYMARKKGNFDEKEAEEACGTFDEKLLNDDNAADDEMAQILYLAGVEYTNCIFQFFSEKFHDNLVYLPFNQVINIHRINSIVYDLATTTKMGEYAATLLQHKSIRLYQTSLILKDESSANIQTVWQRDLNKIPLDTREGGSLTFWCPLLRSLNYDDEDSMLRFISGSHRDVSREHWYGQYQYKVVNYSQARTLNVGDCTIHHGWIQHYSPPLSTSGSRLAIAFTYVIGDATVLRDQPAESRDRYAVFHDDNEYSYRDWMKDLNEGDVIDHPLLPVVFNSRIVFPQKNVFEKHGFDDQSPSKVLYESF